MCGITAFLEQGGSSNQPKHEDKQQFLQGALDESLRIIKHRGPDAQGTWINPDCKAGLGHVRLSIIDLSPSGNQPFHDVTPTSDIHAIVNGELYDYEHYRQQLSPEFNFQGSSDCEIVIALYKHYGISFISRLRGEFAFVLYDARRRLFLAARDRYGIKSLYWMRKDGRLLVGTEMKQFLAFGWKPEWDVRSLKYSQWKYDERTIFKGVNKVMPGQYLISKDFEPFKIRTYWDLDYPDKNIKESRTVEELIQKTRDHLIEAVRIRLRADVPVGIYLSGGLDSSAVAGITAHLMRTQSTQLGNLAASTDTASLTCLSVGFDKESGADESEIAERTAKHLGAKFVLVEMDEEKIASRFEDTAWFSEVVIGDANGAGKLAMSKEAHERGIKVILSGEGSDEHFAGYVAFKADAIREPDPSWSSSTLSPQDRAKALQEISTSTYFPWANHSLPAPESTNRMLNHTLQAYQISMNTMPQFQAWTNDIESVVETTELAEGIDGQVLNKMQHKWHPLHTSEYLWTKTMFPNFLLRYLGDNNDMVHHVESRTPFLDHHLTEFANTIPPSLKMKYNKADNRFEEKWILKEAMRPFITEEIYKRTKHPYIGPPTFKTDGPLHRLCKRVVTRENVEQLGFVEWSDVKEAVEVGWVQRDPLATKKALLTVQLIALSKRFGVATARPDGEVEVTSKERALL